MNSVSPLSLPALSAPGVSPYALPPALRNRAEKDSPAKVQDGAQQFEALLLAQLLHSAHGEKSSWLGDDSDPSGSCAGDFAEQQLAITLAQNGGLGIAKLISQGLAANRSTTDR